MKKGPNKNLLEKYLEDPEFARLLTQEELILEVTETLCELVEKEGISRKELADRLGKSKGFVSQLLNGGRNLTLRTVADILHVLGYKVSLLPYKVESNGKAAKPQIAKSRRKKRRARTCNLKLIIKERAAVRVKLR